MRKFEVTREAVQQFFHLKPTLTKKDLFDMARQSTVCTHPQGNRRYKDVVLQVEGGVIKAVARYGATRGKALCPDCAGGGVVKVFEPCPMCGADGCRYCQGRGGSQIEIPCQTCG